MEPWGTWQKPAWEAFVDPRLAAILTNNRADIEAIVAKIGIGTLLELAPHFINIITTLQKGPSK